MRNSFKRNRWPEGVTFLVPFQCIRDRATETASLQVRKARPVYYMEYMRCNFISLNLNSNPFACYSTL